ncbi:alpha-L-fucosidase [Occallatibacter riparius]|uniref:alpha-L-fucosidase n=1 Tax=Occallatibacter riparius TaxID=1002689 RepID=A0A9J7BT82_9BACT|nr:alpha-L-fucosidase [Occallatibacter riparius]UWZ85856.1 alpha-L-fucosidase [Occallatibacter riparius]
MKIDRRRALSLIGGAPALLLSKKTVAQAIAGAVQNPNLEIVPGPFKGTRESLREWQIPDWYRDAKFGIWAHWGPQSAIEYGDWYARNMYVQGSKQYEYHAKTYGHPTKVGYKDVIPTWKADKFDPDHLLGLYKKAGAKYFCSMGVHHDGFDLWDSKYQPRWNAVNMGPKRDIVGAFRKAADKHGLRFALSEHLAPSYHWFATSHMSDKTGPLAGVPYDGADPANADLYHELPKYYPYSYNYWLVNDRQAPEAWKQHYFNRIKDLIDKYQPDLLYCDGDIFFEEYGLALVANLYNVSANRHGGRCEAVYTSKLPSDCETGTCILDWERGVAAGIPANPWQTDTCIGEWHYNREAQYKSPKYVIDLLVDIVSRNGNLMLNFPLPNSGELDYEELVVLDEITKWMAINSEGIYGTRPWKIFGDGPVANAPATSGGTRFNESGRKDLTAEEARFTTKGDTLYAFVMGWPDKLVLIKPLATSSHLSPPKVRNVELLGYNGKVTWIQDEQGLTVVMPEHKPCEHAIALKIS